MTTYKTEDYSNEAIYINHHQYYTAPLDNNDKEEAPIEEEEDESGDWGKTDPAGGDAPSSPGSAV